MSYIVELLTEAYDKVKEWPEHSETGFMDLLSLRNLVPEAADEITRLRSELANARDEQRITNELLMAAVDDYNNARNAALEAKALTEAEETTATRYATEIIELRAELAKTAALSSIHVDRAEAAEVELDSRTRELDEERVSTRTRAEEARRKAIDEAADVADRLSREWASDAELWHKDGMLKTSAASTLHSEAAGKIAAAIRALKAEGESR